MPNEFIVKNGLIVGGNVVTSGTITINGALAATQSWVTSQAYLTSASLSGYATQSYVTSAIAALVDAAPAALDTLNELAAALGDDANFSTTITNSIANKVAKSGDTMTGSLLFANVADNVRLQKGSSFLNLRDPWNNIHLYNAGDGNYIDSNIHYWRSQSASYWMTLNNGNLGIGTVSPVSRLDVDGIISSRGIFIAQNSGTYNVIYNASNSVSMYLGGSGDPANYYDNTTHNFRSSGGGTTYAVITNGGNVGIGTTAPAQKLDVLGTIRSQVTSPGAGNGDVYAFAIHEYNGNNGRLGLGLHDTGDAFLGLYSDGGVTTRIDSNGSSYFMGGNVGIGTASPEAKLDVSGNIIIRAAAAPQLLFFETGSSYTEAMRLLRSSDKLHLTYGWNASEEALTVVGTGATAGFVGIGTTSPDTPLVVQGGSAGTGGWNRTATLSATYPGLIFNSNGTKWGGMAYDYSAAMRFWVNANNNDIFAGTQAMSILNNGNVGIATSNPIYKLQVAGSAYVNGGTLFLDSSEYLRWGNSNQGIVGVNDSHVAILSGGATRQTIYAEGRTYFPGLDLSISNINGSHGSGTYFRGDGGHFVFGLSDGNTLYLNYGNSSGILRTFGTWYHESTQILSTSRVLTNVSGNISMFTNDAGYLTSETDTLASVTARGASTSTNITFNGNITANSSIIQGYGTILTGYNAGFQITVNATYSGGQTNTYTPQYAGGASAGMFVMKQRNGGEGIMDFYGKQSGTDGSTQAYSTFNHLMTMLPTGNVGIGTTNPTHRLTVAGGNVLMFPSDNTRQLSFFNDSYGITASSGLELITGDYIRFRQGSTELARLTTTGLGIGTTSPAEKLSVVGNVSVTSGEYRLYNNSTVLSATSGSLLSINAGGFSNVSIVNGNLGIGTTSPGYKLDVAGSINIFSGNSLRWGSGDAEIINSGYNLLFKTYTGSALTEKMRITPGGSLLLGDVAVPGESAWYGTAVFGKSGTDKVISGYLSSSTNGAVIGGHNSGLGAWAPFNVVGSELRFSIQENRAVTIDAARNVGVGTSTPSEKFHVSGAAIFDGGSGNSSTDAVVYITKSNNNDWGLYVNASGLDYGMYTRVSPSAGYAIGVNNGTNWTTRITGDGRIYLNEKDTIASYDTWLRLNESSHYGSGVFTPGVMRADGGFQVSGNTVIHSGTIGSQSVSYANNAGYAAEAGQVINQSGQLLRFDNRIISPSETTAGYLQFGFTSWGNDNSSPYADYLHMRSYTDGSGGSDNLVMFLKSGIGMRIYQQTFGSASAYSSYADVWHTGNLTNLNQLTNGPGYITSYSETDTLASVTGRGASTSTNITLSGAGNQFNGHHYFLAYDANGNHYPHYNAGSNANGSKLNLRMFDSSGNAVVFFLNGNDKSIQWNGYTIYHAGNIPTWNQNTTGSAGSLSSMNISQFTNNSGYITGYTETDTLASVTNRGESTTGRINVRGPGNQGGGNIMMGNTGESINKWSYLTSTHYNASSQPQGFALIGGLATSGGNAVVIGGNIYETNPATEIQFWTHGTNTHNLGGTQRGVINSSGNWGIGTTSPGDYKLYVNGGQFGTLLRGGDLGTGSDVVRMIKSDGSCAMIVRGDGNIGIGTFSPTAKLFIEGNDIVLNTEGSVQGKSLYFRYSDGGNIQSDSYLKFSTGGSPTEKMRITDSGLVSIGTTSPFGKLTVAAGASYAVTASSVQRYVMQAINTSNSVNSTYGWWWFHDNNSNMGFHADGIGDILTLTRGGAAIMLGGHTMWHAGNDGSGSGLDADTVDGLQASVFVRNDTYNSADAGLQVFRNIGTIDGSWPSSDHTFGLENSDAGNIVVNFHRGGYTSNNLRYNGSQFRFDAALESTGIITATGGNSTNWNTAYSWGNHASAGYATTSYVTTQINNLIAGAPGALDTLDELAAALGDDSNFATTVTNSIASKLSLSGGTMTGDVNWTQTDRGLTWNMNTDGAYIKFYNTGDGDTNSRLEYATSDNGDEYHRWVIGGTEKMTLKSAGLTINGTITATGYNNSNWDTAYGWGNHASAGYALNSALANYLPLSGGSIGGALTVNGNLTVNGTITENSSIKLKENVETSEGNLEKVVNLRPVTYNKIGSQITELGLIAEEVVEVYPEFVQYDENGEPIGVHYSRLTAALIGAVKELTQRIETLENNG